MSEVQSLVIKLRAQGINVTEKQLRRLGNQSKKTGMSLKSMIAAAGGVYVIEDLHSCSGQWPELYGYQVIQEGDTLTTDLLSSFENNDDTIIETNYISSDMVSKIRSEIEWCQTKIGVEKYVNPKGQTYEWPTMLSFMRKK